MKIYVVYADTFYYGSNDNDPYKAVKAFPTLAKANEFAKQDPDYVVGDLELELDNEEEDGND